MFQRVLVTLVLFGGAQVQGDAGVVFVFDNQESVIGSGLDGQASGMFTVSGLEITVSTSSGLFNATSSGFGINQSESGDDTDGFDFTQALGLGIAENFTISFDQAVQLDRIDVSSFGTSDEITIFVGGTTVASVSDGATTNLGGFSVAANTDISINTTAGSYGNGWSLDFIEATAVPEPSGFAAIALGLGVLVRRRLAFRKVSAKPTAPARGLS
ncbi:MAG: PEP-CTERM sorting domain-containing protein [Rubripirellula sp.]